ncbi:MAG: ABC transporter permease [Gemmatimonas sp.]
MANDQRTWWTRLLGIPGVRLSCVVLLTIVLVALLAPWIVPFDPQLMLDPVALRSRNPTWAHPLGTDPYSRDLLSRVMSGARVSLTLAVSSVMLSTVIGTLIGLYSGFSGGAIDRLLMRLADIGLSVPRVLLLLTIVGLWGTPSIAMLIVVIAATGWMSLGRLVRGEVRAARREERIVAARALGVRESQIVLRHLLPAVVPLIAVSATLGIGQVLLLESGLSYLGIGVPTPSASWGTILLDVGDVMGPGRWLAVGPGLVLVITVLAVHRLGDALQSALEMRQRS